jgi:hypothetical protein
VIFYRNVPHVPEYSHPQILRRGRRIRCYEAREAGWLAAHIDIKCLRRVQEEEDQVRRDAALRTMPVVPAPRAMWLLEARATRGAIKKVRRYCPPRKIEALTKAEQVGGQAAAIN